MKKSQINLNQRGFALIATIAILSLVLLVALAMVSLSASTTKSVGYGYHHEIAKANAKLALQTALNQLQRYAGPDQRVTANASILDSKVDTVDIDDVANPYWLGVWKTTVTDNSREYPAIDRAQFDMDDDTTFDPQLSPYKDQEGSEYYLVDARKKALASSDTKNYRAQWRKDHLLGWLVSNPVPYVSADALKKLGDIDSLKDMDKLPSVILYDDLMDDFKIKAPLVPINGVKGSYAFHVAGENLKVNIAASRSFVKTSNVKEKEYENNRRLIVGQSRAIDWMDVVWKENEGGSEKTKTLKFKPASDLDIEDANFREKLLSFETAGFDEYENGDFGNRLRRHLTTTSTGLFTNSATGGLKTDLSYYFTKGEVVDEASATPAAAKTTIFYPGILDKEPILKSIVHSSVGPKFGSLRGWSNIDIRTAMGKVPSSSSSFDDRVLNSPLYPKPRDGKRGTNSLTTYMEGKAPDITKPYLVVDNSGNDKVGMPLHPIVVKARMGVEVSYEESKVKAGQYEIRTMIYPLVSIYNPYNVDIENVELAIVFPASFRAEGADHFDQLKNKTFGVRVGNNSWGKKKSDPSLKEIATAKEYFSNESKTLKGEKMIFVTEKTNFPAGKTLMFSPKIMSSLPERHQLYDIDSPKNNILTSKQEPESEYFYFNSDVVMADNNGKLLAPIDFVNKNYTVRYSLHNTNLLIKGITKGASITPSDVGIVGDDDFPTAQQIYTSGGGLKLYHPKIVGGGKTYTALSNYSVDYNFDGSFPYPSRFMYERKLLNKPPVNDLECSWKINPIDYVKRPQDDPAKEINYIDPVLHYPTVANFNIRATSLFRSPSNRHHNDKKKRLYGSVMIPWNALSDTIVERIGTINEMLNPSFPDKTVLDAKYNPIMKKAFATDSSESAFDFPWGLPGVYEGVEDGVILFDVPTPELPVYSIARLRHAPVSPFSWNSSYIIANGHIHPAVDVSATASRKASVIGADKRWEEMADLPNMTDLIGEDAIKEDVLVAFDMSYELNHRLFNNYFFSSIDYNNVTNFSTGSLKTPWNFERDELPVSNNKALFNTSEFKNSLNSLSNAPTIKEARDLLLAASHMGNLGSFNVNSSSVEAWVAFLASGANLDRHTLDDTDVSASKQKTSFARLLVAQTNERATELDNWFYPYTTADKHMNSAITLDRSQIRELAKSIVKQVKLRGPYLSLGDFVNRELPNYNSDDSIVNNFVDTKAELGIKRGSSSYLSTLEIAIREAKLNSALQNLHSSTGGYTPYTIQSLRMDYLWKKIQQNFVLGSQNKFGLGVNTQKFVEYRNKDFPNSLNQGDILEPLAPSMTARDDTFVIRSYGDSRDKDGKIMAKAYLEVVVQRFPEYVDGNKADTQPYVYKYIQRAGKAKLEKILVNNPKFTTSNRTLGRKIKVISTKWLSADDI